MRLLIFILTVFYSLSTLAVIHGTPLTVGSRGVGGNTVTDFIANGIDDLLPVVEPPVVGNTGDPFIAYSDLTYGPSVGWSAADPNKGAVVTIYGRNFGTTRGSSYVTVNGVQLNADVDFVDDWAKTSNPIPFLQSITFQLNTNIPAGVGTISVTAGGITSNSVPFTVGSGSIAFVSATAPTSGTDGSITNPWHCSDFKTSLSPGNVIYFRGGTYSSMCNGGKSIIWIKDTNTSGTSAAPIAIAGYPGEDAFMDHSAGDITNANKGIVADNHYMTIAKFRVSALESAIRGNDFSRVIANNAIGAVEYLGGAGIVAAGGDGALVIGNWLHGGRSQRKLDHAIYFSGCQETVGGVAAWNLIDDNDFGSPLDPADSGYGALIVDNHQEVRCTSDQQLQSLRVHNNLISCENFYARAIGIHKQSWDAGTDTAGEPEPALVYNNITINCGVADAGTIEQPVPDPEQASPVVYQDYDTHAGWFNNLFFNSHGGMSVSGSVLSSAVQNNAFTRSSRGTIGACNGSAPSPNSHNSVFGGCADAGTNSITADPLITFGSIFDYTPISINTASPLKNAGTPILSLTVNGDVYDGVDIDFLGNPRSTTTPSIGALEIQ